MSRKLIGYTLKTLAQTSLSTCADICQQKVNCKSINYNRKHHICELNSESDSDFLQITPGWLFSENDQLYLEGNIYQCGHIQCQQNETCIKSGDKVECKIEECDSPSNVESETVLGNMNNVGNVLASEFDNGCGFSYFVCNEEGRWQYLKEARYELICSYPPQHSPGLEIHEAFIKTYEGLKYVTASNDSYISAFSVKQESTVIYHCKNASYLIGNSTRNCTLGQWSMPSISCIDICPDYKSYSYSLHECIDLMSCDKGYADTFQKHTGTAMWMNNYDTIYTAEEQECVEACRSDTQCNSFDYSKLFKRCHLQRLNPHDNTGTSFLYIGTWSYYQRDCN
ncbi:uncharacterized protein LOC132723005 [Ruditapes philippinarum]|uniref:uncharacterized protein LOC132723005 n=1 Tax=Ruditapes philippinarum TaxID=129788 RepID=UPI00295AB231|nr:uncharacterized protein LOC132723005 [Ruditapes philippinarum]